MTRSQLPEGWEIRRPKDGGAWEILYEEEILDRAENEADARARALELASTLGAW